MSVTPVSENMFLQKFLSVSDFNSVLISFAVINMTYPRFFPDYHETVGPQNIF